LSYFGRGDAYLKEHQPDLAIADFTKVLELDPRAIYSYVLRAEAYYQKGLYDLAIADLDFYRKHNPKDDRALYLRGEVYKQRGNLDQAISDFTEILAGTGIKRIEALHARAEAFLMKKDYNNAWMDVQEAEKLGHPVSAEFLMKLRQHSGQDQ
jgi:tetratricopeptide (TPR) repeat protein